MEDEPLVIIVMLRQPFPASTHPNEMRSDPFYEFGSFGCTGCHSATLMNRRNIERVQGHRLAFAQGGRLGFRLVHLTPPIRIRAWKDRCEALWAPFDMPFRYEKAPLLADNDGDTDFPDLKRLFETTQRNSFVAGFASRFRSRIRPLPLLISREIVQVYSRKRAGTGKDEIAASYEEALPFEPPLVDRERRETYEGRLRELGGEISPKRSRC